MPRYRRQHAPGAVQHLISRFVDNEFRLDHGGARAEYLRRVPKALARSGWRAIAFALMSSHVHWLLVASSLPSDSFVRSLNGGFANWLNRAQGRRGPVFADRHRVVICTGESAAAVMAYIHNNPVRAGASISANASVWTSHRAYLGLAPEPEWLDVELGLQLAGFASTREGRRGFGAFVAARSGEPRSDELTGGDLQRQRREARARLVSPVEVATPIIERRPHGFALHVPVVSPEGCLLRTPWHGPPDRVLAAVANALRTPVGELVSRRRTPHLVEGRRLSLLLWTAYLGRRGVEMARALGIASSSASELTATAAAELHQTAARLADALRADRRARTQARVG